MNINGGGPYKSKVQNNLICEAGNIEHPQQVVYENFDEEKCIETLNLLEKIWATNNTEKLNVTSIIKMIDSNLQFKEILNASDALTSIQIKQDDSMKDVNMLRSQMVKNSLIVESDFTNNYSKRINKILEMIFYSCNTMKALARMQRCADIKYDPAINDDWGVIRFTTCDYDTLKPAQQLINDILYIFWDKGYKRFKDACYKPIKTKSGFNSFAYEYVNDIENVIYYLSSDQFAQNSLWRNTTGNVNNVKACVRYLQKCNDVRFAPLEKDRHIWSWDNGFYVARLVYNGVLIKDKFFKYTDPDAPQNIVSAKYFNSIFPEDIINKHWKDIDTPIFNSIFKAQNINTDIINCVVQCFIGRSLYDVGELDDWQVTLFILGQAGTGKSTLLTKVIKEFYDNSDVAVMSNNIERKFGLMSLWENFVIIAPELKKDCTLDQAEFQQMVSGEDVSVARKNESALSIKWKPPILGAGNQMPRWNDNSGSISRRMAILRFLNTIVEGDTKLGEKLLNEIVYILVKANKGYLEALDTFGTDDIWKHLHPYFKDNRRKIAVQTNSLMHFIENKCSIDAKSWTRCDDLLPLLNDHCRQYNFSKESWTPEFYTSPLYTYKLSITNNFIDQYGVKHPGQVIVGLQIN